MSNFLITFSITINNMHKKHLMLDLELGLVSNWNRWFKFAR